MSGRTGVEIPFPDFFLVGAPRCGTTALTLKLKHHPSVCFSRPKEPHYFTKIEPLLPDADLRTHYLERHYWSYDPDRHQLLGEGSVSTLYSPEAIERIRSLNPDVKFLVVVRNPMEMLPSYHQLLLYYLDEEVEDFEEAWGLEAERARGEHIPAHCLEPRLLQYTEMAMLGKRVEELFQIAGRDHCHVVMYDDLVADPKATHLRILDFLGLEDEDDRNFKHKNPSRAYRWRWLHRLLFRPPMIKPEKLLSLVTGRTRKTRHSRIRRLRARLTKWNTVPQRPTELPPALREEMRATFQEDIERLGKLLDRDLSSWR